MYNFIFACYVDLEKEFAMLSSLVKSVRQFTYPVNNLPFIAAMDETQRDLLSPAQQEMIKSYDVTVEWMTIPQKYQAIPYFEKTLAAGEIEHRYLTKCKRIIWMDVDSLFFQFSDELLNLNKPIACRPVDLKNISCLYNEPLDSFWQEIYGNCSVRTENLFKLVTTVDEKEIYSQFNAGLLIVEPRYQVLGLWKDYFENCVLNHEWQKYNAQDKLYQIFIHQAFLNVAISSIFTKEDIHLLDYRVNYSLANHYRYPLQKKVESLDNLVSVRLDNYLTTGNFSEFTMKDELRSWLTENVMK